MTPRPDDKAADIEAIKRRCEAASNVPWEPVDNRDDSWGLVEVEGPSVMVRGFTVASDVSHEEAVQVRADRDFIAHARQDIPALLSLVAKLERKVTQLRGECGDPADKERIALLEARAIKAEAALQEKGCACHGDPLCIHSPMNTHKRLLQAEKERDEAKYWAGRACDDAKNYQDRQNKAESALSESRAHGARLADLMRDIMEGLDTQGTVGWSREELVAWGKEVQRVLSQTPASVKEWVEGVKREAKAEAFEEAADRCWTRSTDAKLAAMPVVLQEELRSRATYFLEQARALREGLQTKQEKP